MYRGKLFFQSKNTFKTLSISEKGPALIQTEGWRLQIDSLRKQRHNMSENHINCFCLCDSVLSRTQALFKQIRKHKFTVVLVQLSIYNTQ